MITEALEQRRLLSVSVKSGVLCIWGTPQDDVLRVAKAQEILIVEVNGQTTTVPADWVVGISASLGQGNDRFEMPGVWIPATVVGEEGNDYIRGGLANDSLSGGSGADTIVGAWGDDTLIGGRGRDFLRGGLGNDEVRGALGIDVIQGGEGRDTLYGGGRADQITGGKGEDVAYGGDDDDEMFLEDGQASDTVYGGEGHDTAYGDFIAGRTDLTEAEWYALATSGAEDPVAPDMGASTTVVFVPVVHMGVNEECGQRFFQFYTPNESITYASGVFDWGDGQTSDAQVLGNEMGADFIGGDHRYTQPGTYAITLSVSIDGKSFTLRSTAVVDAMPTVDLDATWALAGKDTPIQAAMFYRIEGDSLEDYTAVINWGDGTFSEGTVSTNSEWASLRFAPQPTVAPGKLLVVSGLHKYEQTSGRYLVRVLIQSDTRKALASRNLLVAGSYMPEFVAIPASVSAGSTPAIILGTLQYVPPALEMEIDWGDGNISPGDYWWESSADVGRQYLVTGRHAYTSAGEYSVKITLKYFDQATTFTTRVTATPALPIQWRAESIAEYPVIGQVWKQAIATFPASEGDSPEEYSATLRFLDHNLAYTIERSGDTYTLYVNDPLQWSRGGGDTLNVQITGRGGGAQFGIPFVYVAEPVEAYLTTAGGRAVVGQLFNGLLGNMGVRLYGDPRPAVPTSADVSVEIDWGDGTRSVGEAVFADTSSSPFVTELVGSFYGSHGYSSAGLAREGTLKVTWGSRSWTGIFSVNVAPA